jgi:hypothetical protein
MRQLYLTAMRSKILAVIAELVQMMANWGVIKHKSMMRIALTGTRDQEQVVLHSFMTLE